MRLNKSKPIQSFLIRISKAILTLIIVLKTSSLGSCPSMISTSRQNIIVSELIRRSGELTVVIRRKVRKRYQRTFSSTANYEFDDVLVKEGTDGHRYSGASLWRNINNAYYDG